jgi:HSP20 family protein
MQQPVSQTSEDTVRSATSFRPNIDIVSAENEVVILADMPGVEPEGIEVKFDRGVLELYAKVIPRNQRRNPLSEEYAVGDFRRAFQLAEEFDGAKTSAEFHDGVLCLRIPKAAVARSQRVQIRAGKG